MIGFGGRTAGLPVFFQSYRNGTVGIGETGNGKRLRVFDFSFVLEKKKVAAVPPCGLPRSWAFLGKTGRELALLIGCKPGNRKFLSFWMRAGEFCPSVCRVHMRYTSSVKRTSSHVLPCVGKRKYFKLGLQRIRSHGKTKIRI